MKDFFDKMVQVGIVKPDTDYKKAYTLAVRQQRALASTSDRTEAETYGAPMILTPVRCTGVSQT